MKSKRCLNVLLVVLVAGVIGQSFSVAGRKNPAVLSSGPPSVIQLGDTLLSLTGFTKGGVATTIRLAADPGTVTVLYAFHPDCVHCLTVAPTWAEHFSANASTTSKTVRRIAVAHDSAESALDYANRFGWNVGVLSLGHLSSASRDYSLVSKTPWLFVFDSDGVLRFHGHGSQLEQVDQAVADLSDAAGAARFETIG